VPPETDLGRLLASIEPRLQEGAYAFCSLSTPEPPAGLAVRLLFREPEGTTVIVSLDEARSVGLTAQFPCQWIVLAAESDLGAVGFLAAITTRLAEAGISANAVSAVHHDHLFVPLGRGEQAVAVLRDLQSATAGPRR
jgi:uncharacterized protein